ncbi:MULTISPECIES: cytochrome-c peroxidase [Hyphobacterium]|uniref:Cytochrome-c peroxidase n=1 Tax=Hyphobacterium vulgare TaxID=1736751 RepID=A0ABV6ZY31_9PROT
MTRTFNGAFALTTALFLVAASPSDGQTSPILDLAAAEAAIPMDAATRIEPGSVIRLPDGAAGLRIRVVTIAARPLGDIAITGTVDGTGEQVRLTLGGAGYFTAAGMERWRPDGSGQGQFLPPGSLAAADLAEEERLVVSRTLAALPPDARGMIAVQARLGDSFVRRHGLASRLRAQDLAEAVNATLASEGRPVSVELVALRGAGTGASSTPGIAFAGLDTIAADVIVAAVLPSSRAVRVGDPATAFATVINAGAGEATSCGLALTGASPAGSFSYQITDALNQPAGTPDTPVNIPANGAQSYIFSFTPSATFEPGGDLPLEFTCTNRASAVVNSGVNTLWFSASANAVPDIIAIAETGASVGLNSLPGVVDIHDRQRSGPFAVATANVGAAGTITVSAAPTSDIPVTVRICQTDPGTGACLAAPAPDLTLDIIAGATPSFAVFAAGDTPISFAPATNRIRVLFSEGGAVRGSTTVAIRTLLTEPILPEVSFLYADADVNLPNYYRNGPVAAADNTPIGNRITNAGATLGRVLFYDRRLSLNNAVSCASCHVQALGFSDDGQFSTGFEGGLTGRHSPGLTNARYYDRGHFFWDERADTLEDQVLVPIPNEVEMGLPLDQAVARVAAEDFYAGLFTDAFGDAGVTSERMALAMAQFVRSMTSHNSRFDQALDAGPVGSAAFQAQLTEQEYLGLQLFMPVPGSDIQALNCGACHTTLAHISDDIHNIGLDATNDADAGAGNGAFKAPSLRNVGVRTEFMHDGRFTTLAEVVEFYNSGVQNTPGLDNRMRQGPNPQRLNLTDEEKAALEAFLHTLTDQDFLTDPRFSDPFAN